jgi:hypothetical protein
MLETLRFVAAHRDEVKQVVASSQRPRDRIAVRYRLERQDAPIEILTRTPRSLAGAPTTVTLPYLSRFVGTTVIDRPIAYLVPEKVAAHLRQHGLTVQPATGPYEVEVPVVERAGSEGARGILEAGSVGELSVSWRKGARSAPPGAGLVATSQPLGAIAVYLCEPESDDGAVENGLIPVPNVGEELPIWRVPG